MTMFSRTSPRTFAPSLPLALTLCFLLAVPSLGQDPPNWDTVTQLIEENKLESAARVAGEVREAAHANGDDAAYTRALVQETLLRTGLQGYETAVAHLRKTPWPETPRLRAIVQLYYAQALVTYMEAYSWDIRQRERSGSVDDVEPDAWTLDQTAAEVHRSFFEAWQQREGWDTTGLGELSEFFGPGTFPASVRGTLRDVVTYLWVDLLTDKSLWRPEHTNGIFRLNRRTLINGQTEGPAPDLNDPAVHPLLKLTHLLDDLEHWHLEDEDNRRPEAALETRRVRAQKLWLSLDKKEERQAILAHLEDGLDVLGSSFPWWSMGQATRAELLQQSDVSNRQVLALEVARTGYRAHPQSAGGERCAAIIQRIEQPQFALETQAFAGEGQRALQVRHKNLETLHFRAYNFDPESILAAGMIRPWGNFGDYRKTIAKHIQNMRPVAEWQVDLPETPDFEFHKTWVTPKLVRGAYHILASARADFSDDDNSLVMQPLIVNDLVLVEAHDERPEFAVLSGTRGTPRPGVNVRVYRYDYNSREMSVAAEQESDANGLVRFDDFPHGQRATFVPVARSGDDITFLNNRSYWQHDGESETRRSAIIYTDRSVYRPGQRILWKAVGYEGRSEKEFTTLAGEEIEVSLSDVNGEQVAAQKVTLNSFGSASGEFQIPTGRLLGQWYLRTSIGGRSMPRIEEYKRPTFEVEWEDPQQASRLNENVTLQGSADYYFGLPVTDGQVEWRVTRKPIWPLWWWQCFWVPPNQQGADEVIAQGVTRLDSDGHFQIEFLPEADPDPETRAPVYRFQVEADVTDDGGETRSGSRQIDIGWNAVQATFVDPPDFIDAGSATALPLRRADVAGVPRAGEGRWRLLRVNQPDEPRMPADRLLPAEENVFQTPGDRLPGPWYQPPVETELRSWEDGEEVAKGTVSHGEDGLAEIQIPALEKGVYRLRYGTEDPFGETFELAREIFVADSESETPLSLPVVLRPQKSTVAFGDSVRLLVGSGFPDQEIELRIYRVEKPMERRRLQGMNVIEIPVGENERGGFGLTAAVLRDHQWVELQKTITVPWDDRRLRVELATFRDRLRPSDRETWTVRVHGNDEETLNAGSAELLAYMYDRSLDIIAPHTPADPLEGYARWRGYPHTMTSLQRAHGGRTQNTGKFQPIGLPPLPHPAQLLDISAFGFRNVLGKIRAPRGRLAPRMSMARAMPAAPGEQIAEELSVVAQSASAEVSDAGDSGLFLDDGAVEVPPSVPLRTDFSETAFWEPHLLLEEDGSVSFEFEVPDSLTEWSVWAHALTNDLRAGSTSVNVRTVKDLMIRPYLPRFLRRGDQLELRVMVQAAGENALEGNVRFDLINVKTEAVINDAFGLDTATAPFQVESQDGVELVFPITVPQGGLQEIQDVAIRAVAQSGDLSDGELRPLPILPSRIHLVQSRSIALKDKDRRTLKFEDLARVDPTRLNEQFIVTVDGQLFYGVLSALPYLVDYPYECTEQTLNRFLSTAILSSLYDDYPAVAKMAEQLSERAERLERWNEDDPNRRMALVETPWLRASRGGVDEGLINVLVPEIANAQRKKALKQLEEAQLPSGAFPWFPGGPPSPYITLYLLDGFSRALEFGVDVPKRMVTNAWRYLRSEAKAKTTGRPYNAVYISYLLSSYPDFTWTQGVFTADDRDNLLDQAWNGWQELPTRSKWQLAVALERAGRHDDAKLILDAIMDSSRTTDDEGTFWMPEDRAWLWYNDTVENHAFALRAMTEITPDDERRGGLVQWLFLNKKMNHWKSTRATAEAIYSLAHYMKQEDLLGAREEIRVRIGGAGDPVREETLVFSPDAYTGRDAQVILAPEKIDRRAALTEVAKDTRGLAFASATWHFSTEELPEAARGDFFTVDRQFFRRRHDGREWLVEPLSPGESIAVGDQVEVQLTLTAKQAAEFIHLRDPRAAGLEPEALRSGYRWDRGLPFYEEVRDSGANFFLERLPAGEYTFRHRLRATVAGTFRFAPAVVQSMYAPELTAYSAGRELAVEASE